MYRVNVQDLVLEVPGRRLLNGVRLTVEQGVSLAIMGPSGSGKTSLLNTLAGITLPAAGSIHIDDHELTRLGLAERTSFRLHNIGMVFQFGELLPELTVVENVSLPLRLIGVTRQQAEERAMIRLERLGLGRRSKAHPDALSGGEIQRVAIARALVHEPRLVLADEPSGALDEASTRHVIAMLVNMATELGATVIVATHDPLVAAATDKVLQIHDGLLTSPLRDTLTEPL